MNAQRIEIACLPGFPGRVTVRTAAVNRVISPDRAERLARQLADQATGRTASRTAATLDVVARLLDAADRAREVAA